MQDGQEAGWQFNSNDSAANSSQSYTETGSVIEPAQTVSWTASEYASHDKNFVWYASFTGACALIIGVIFLVTRDWISVIILAVFAVAFGVFAGRKPGVLNYAIDAQGIHIGNKTYPLTLFRSFAIVQEGGMHTISLLPLKRFMPPISVFFDPKDEQKIVETLGGSLPQEDRQQDFVDKFMHKIRF